MCEAGLTQKVSALLDTLPEIIHSRRMANTTTPAWPIVSVGVSGRRPLYTPEQRLRRDASPWTVVQGVLAPVQFLAFAVSVVLVLRVLLTGEGVTAATASVVVKTALLYTIMVTGAVWEKKVFGRYLFAEAFFWEDVFSMLVLALHTTFLIATATDALDAHGLMVLALAAYATYVINAGQFILKLRAARLDERAQRSAAQVLA
jgi:3-vinyl bacteriochlorophyllide hydratase